MDLPILIIVTVQCEGRAGYHIVYLCSSTWRGPLERFRTRHDAVEYASSFYAAYGYPQLYRGIGSS